jgi:hypothetical protein
LVIADRRGEGKKLGLMLDAGVGLKTQPAVRQAIARAGKAFARAGAIVEPATPFFTRGMLDGLDVALRALGQVFLMREKAVAAMRKFDFLLSPTFPSRRATPADLVGRRA